MELFFELFAEAILEALLQIVCELLVWVGFREASERRVANRTVMPFFSFLGYLVLGALLGGLSLLVFSGSLSNTHAWKLTTLILIPILAGLMMSWIGLRNRKKGKDPLRLESFLFGWVFAFAFALVRVIALS